MAQREDCFTVAQRRSIQKISKQHYKVTSEQLCFDALNRVSWGRRDVIGLLLLFLDALNQLQNSAIIVTHIGRSAGRHALSLLLRRPAPHDGKLVNDSLVCNYLSNVGKVHYLPAINDRARVFLMK